jgi:glyoxylase-like metal-dependent hydrolase (beta-lactamase superfamily II)
MIFRQLFEPVSSTFTYLIGCPETGVAVLVDPVLETVERDLDEVRALGLSLGFTLETHIHADHVTSAARLRALTGCKVAYPALDGAEGADLGVGETAPLRVGNVTLQPLFTPGHTDNHHCYLIETPAVGGLGEGGGAARVLTGDTLLIDGCGRTDFQCGDARALYRSVNEKLFALGDATIVHPGHDYKGRQETTIGAERAGNARLGGGRKVEEFVAIMAALGLPHPRLIDVAVPANKRCGEIETNLYGNTS